MINCQIRILSHVIREKAAHEIECLNFSLGKHSHKKRAIPYLCNVES